MAFVSVGQVENLEEAILVLQATYDAMETACQTKIAEAENKQTDVQQEADDCTRLLDTAVEAEMTALQQLDQARGWLSSAKGELSLACSSLSVCESSGSFDDDGNYEPPDCYYEEAEVSAAESLVIQREEAVSIAEESFETAKDYRMQMEYRNELSHRCLEMATQLTETVQTECYTRLAVTLNLIENGKSRLEHAKTALYSYLDINPTAAEFYSWLKWSPQTNVQITPKELHKRLNLSAEQQSYLLEYLSDRDPLFRAKVAEYRNQLELSKGPAEKHAIQLKIRRNMSGYFSEKIVEKAFSPLGQKTDTQAKTIFDNGRFTKTDLIIEGLKVPVILGRGEGMSAPVNGSIAIEVKCGRASYLYSQKNHMVFQSKGHQKSTASMTVCSRDIKELDYEKEEELRALLRDSGSPLIGMLPMKDEIDKACWDIVSAINPKMGSYHEN